MHDMSIRPE